MRRAGELARDLGWAAFALAAAGLALYALIRLEHEPLPPGAAQVSDHAELAIAGDTPPPLDSAQWQRVELPHTLRHVDPPAGSAWYLMHLEIEQVPVETWALLLPHLRLNAELFLNGTRLGDPSAMDSPIARRFNHPRLLTLPRHALHEGENLLLVHLVTEPEGFGSLGRVYLGERETLRAAYERLFLLKVSVPLMVVPLMASMALLFFALWWRRREPAHGWFVLVAAAWTVETLDFVVTDPPAPAAVWDWLMFVSVGWMSVFWVHFAHRFTGTRWPALERVLLAYGVLYSCAVLIPDHRLLWQVAITLCNPINGLCCIYGCARFYLAARKGQPDTYLLWVVTLSGYAFAGYDSLVIGDLWLGSESRYLYFAAPLLMLAIGRSLILRFIRALGEAETLNRELEARVQAKTREIEASQQSLRALEVEARLLAERSRIMYDMHDSVGGQLVATLAAVRHGGVGMPEVAESLSDALDDLRLVIDSLDPENTTLPALLGTLRRRLERQTAPLGMRLQWPGIAELEQLPALPQDHALQLVRIVQEAATNAIKHARARTLVVKVGRHRLDGHEQPCLEIADDGIGLGLTGGEAASTGRGLSSMRLRAQRMQAELDIDSDAHGTRLRICLPAPGAQKEGPDAGSRPNERQPGSS